MKFHKSSRDPMKPCPLQLQSVCRKPACKIIWIPARTRKVLQPLHIVLLPFDLSWFLSGLLCLGPVKNTRKRVPASGYMDVGQGEVTFAPPAGKPYANLAYLPTEYSAHLCSCGGFAGIRVFPNSCGYAGAAAGSGGSRTGARGESGAVGRAIGGPSCESGITAASGPFQGPRADRRDLGLRCVWNAARHHARAGAAG